MITSGPCSNCGGPLASDQRYCIECGTRVGAPLALPYAPATPAQAKAAAAGTGFWAAIPVPFQMATTCAALALGFGVVVGTAISPGIAQTVAGTVVVQQAPPAPEPEPVAEAAPVTQTASADPAPVAEAFPSSTVADTGTTDTGGGGSGKTKEPKEKPSYTSGTVVHANPVAGSYTLATGGGLIAVHAKALPVPGTNVRVPVRTLANRTNAEDGKRQAKGQAAQATFTGTITFAQDTTNVQQPPYGDVYVVSSHGSSLLIHSKPDPTGQLKPPAVGASVTVTAEIRARVEPPAVPDPTLLPAPAPSCAPPTQALPTPPVIPAKELYESGLTVDTSGAPPEAVEIETVVQAACPAGPGPNGQLPARLMLSADDVREAGLDLEAPVDAAIDVGAVPPGRPLIVSLALVDTGGVKTAGTVTGLRNDQGVLGADDKAGGQGDLTR